MDRARSFSLSTGSRRVLHTKDLHEREDSNEVAIIAYPNLINLASSLAVIAMWYLVVSLMNPSICSIFVTS